LTSLLHNPKLEWLYLIGRLKPGAEVAQAQSHLTLEVQQWLWQTGWASATPEQLGGLAGLYGPARVLILRVLDYADHFIVPAMTRIFEAEVLRNWVFLVEELAGESLVNDSDALGSRHVALLDGAPSQQARTDSLKVMGADPIPRGRRSLEVRRVSFDVHALVPVVASQRTVA
jgi:hypothetical protein